MRSKYDVASRGSHRSKARLQSTGRQCVTSPRDRRCSSWATQLREANAAARAQAKATLMRPLEPEEFYRHLNKRAGMAAGLDGMTWDILQHLPDESKKKIFACLRNFLDKGYDHLQKQWTRFPKWFGRAWTSPIPKNDFDFTTARCRGITVTPAIGRLLGKIITARLTTYVESVGCLCSAQMGFRRGRSSALSLKP
jgi:hypothetical protein